MIGAQQGVVGGIEAVVVDSGSSDGAQAVVRKHNAFARLVEIAPASFGYARAHNIGAAHARGEFVIRLSGDAVPAHERWAANLIAPLACDPGLCATWGGQVLPPHVTNPMERLARRLYYGPNRPFRRYTTDQVILGTNMAVRRALWAARSYDERLPQAEDLAWTHFWQKRGWATAFVPDAPVIHGHQEPLPRALRRAFAQTVLSLLIRYDVIGR